MNLKLYRDLFSIIKSKKNVPWQTIFAKIDRVEFINNKITYFINSETIIKLNYDFKHKGYYADPFHIFFLDKIYLFTEFYCFDRKRGVIRIFEIFKSELKYINEFDFGYHTSYPFVVNYKDGILLVPETSETFLQNFFFLENPFSKPFLIFNSKSKVVDLTIIEEGIAFGASSGLTSGDFSEERSLISYDIQKKFYFEKKTFFNPKFVRPGGLDEKDKKLFFQNNSGPIYGNGLSAISFNEMKNNRNSSNYDDFNNVEIKSNSNIFISHHAVRRGDFISFDYRCIEKY
jgi:hypothetical protein